MIFFDLFEKQPQQKQQAVKHTQLNGRKKNNTLNN